MQELAETLAKFGPGVAYGTDTVQSLIDNLINVDYSALLRAFPTLVNPSTDSRHYYNDEFLELDQFRELIIKNIAYFLQTKEPEYPKINKEILPTIEAPMHVIYRIFLPIIEKITTAKKEPIIKVISQFSSMLQKSASFEENWDLPVITNRLLLWMSSILEKKDVDQDVVTKIISLWLQIIESTHRTEYILRLVLSWFKVNIDQSSIDITPLVASIKKHIKPTTFADYDIVSTNTLYLPEIMVEGTKKPSALKEVRQRRIAAHKGFLYVAEPTTGLTKFGTGICGTVFASNERSSSSCINCDAHSLCVCDNHLLLGYQGQAKGVIDVMAVESLERVGQLVCDTPIPNGPFTAAGDKLYIISKSVLYVYQKKGLKITLVYQIGLKRTEREFFAVPLPRDYEKYVTLITDGLVIGIIFAPFLIGNNQTPIYHQYSIKTGQLMTTSASLEEHLASMYVAVDLEGNSIIEAPFWDTVKVSELSPVYRFNREYSSIEKTDIIPLRLLNALLPLLASRVSLKAIDMSLPFSLQNTDLIFNLIELMAKDKRYEIFADTIVSMVAIFEYQSAEYHTYQVEDIMSILDLKSVSSISRINFMRSFVRGFKQNFLMTTSDCVVIIQKLTPEEVTKIFEDGFHDIFGFLLAILNEKDNRILKYCKEHISEQYPFLNAMTFSLSRGIFVIDAISCSAAVPLLNCIQEANTYVLPTLLAPIMPLIFEMMKCDAIVAAAFPQISTILASLEGLCSAIHLQKYAKKHFESRVSSNLIETTVVEESPHPYENNTSYIHPYNFPGAVRITITFDPQTETEAENDYLEIFSDPECKNRVCDRLSGKFENWQKIITNCDHLSFKFTSDPSINLYGYKAYIEVKSFETTLAYKSPQIFYDLSRALFLILLNVSKRYDSPPDGFTPETFSFPQGLEIIPFTREDSVNLLTKIREKFDMEEGFEEEQIQYFDPCSSFPISYAYLKYIYEHCTPESGSIYYLLQLAAMHPEVAEAPYHDQSEMFSEIGALLMQNTLGLHDDMYQFLFSTLKDSKGKSFALRSFQEAGVLCETPNPSFEIVLQAATKIQIGLSIIGPHIIDENDGIIQKFLAAYRNVVIPVSAPSILRLNEKIRSIFTEIATSADINSKFFTLVRENLALVDQTPPTSSNPFVLFALAIADSLDVHRECSDFVLSVILLSLPFNTTQTIPLLQSILKTFSFQTSIEEKPELIGILESIGRGFSFNIATTTEHELFDIGPPFSFARAIIVRQILDESKLDQLTPIIKRKDEASLGALLVLSARNFPPHIHQQVKINSTGQTAIISSMDYLEYRFMNDDGLSFSVPALDVSSFEYSEVPFVPILPKRFGPVPQSLVDAVMDVSFCDDEQISRFARSALSELTYSTPLPLNIAKKFQFKAEKQTVDNSPPRLVLRHLREGDTYVCTKSVPSFSVVALPGMIIGYCSGTAETTFQSFKVTITPEKMISFPSEINQPVLKLESDTITMGFFGQYKQLFIQTGDLFVMPPVFLSIFEEPSPVIIYKKEPHGFDPNPPAPTFLMKPLLQMSSVFTHVAANHRLISLLLENMEFNGVSPNHIHFLPPISNLSNYTYIEFNLNADMIKVAIHPDTMRTVNLYNTVLENTKPSSTYGLMIDEREKVVFITKNGVIQRETMFIIILNSPFTVEFDMKGAETLSVNSGFTPFIFNVNKYLNEERKNITEIPLFDPVLDPDNIPYSFEPIYQGTLPFDLSTVVGESQRKADVKFERPCILTAPDIDSKLFNRTAVFTPIEGTDKANVKLINVRSQSWISLDLPLTYVYSIADCSEPANVFAAHERMQRSLKPFLSPWLYFPPSELAKQNMALLTPAMKKQFFETNDNIYSCLINAQSAISHIDCFNDEDLEEFVTDAATVLGNDDFSGKCCVQLTPIFSVLAKERPEVFEKLVDKSMNALLYNHKMENVVVSNKPNDVLVEVERRNADAIYVRSKDSNFSLPLKLNNISLKNSCLVEKETDNAQCTMPGDMITVQMLEKDQLAFLDILPISLTTSDPLHCFRLALQLISFIVCKCKEYKLEDMLHEKIILPLFKRIMSGGTVLFGFIVAEWLLAIVNDNLLRKEDMKKYSKLISLEVMRSMKDPQLAVALPLFSLFAYASGGDDAEVREHLAAISEPFLESEDSTSPASLIFHRIAADLLSPFSQARNVFPFLNSLKPPFISSFAFNALLISRKYEEKYEMRPEDTNSPKQTLTIQTNDSPSAYLHLSRKTPNPKVSINEEFVTEDGFIKIVDNEIDVTVLRDDGSRDLLVTITLEPPKRHASYNDFYQIYKYYSELSDNWTQEDEGKAAALASSVIDYNSLFLFEDDIFEKMFPSVSPGASRFRVATLLLLALSQGTFELKPSRSMRPFLPFLTPTIVQYNKNVEKQDCYGYIPISILSLTNFYARAAQQFSSHGCFPGDIFIHEINLLNIKDPITILRVVRTAKNDIFEAPFWEDNAALLPKADAVSLDELGAFLGFGFHMMLNAAQGRSLPLPVSAVVIRYAFGGKIIARDFNDIDTAFAESNPTDEEIEEKIKPIKSQLRAIRCGTSMALEGRRIFDSDNPVFPWILQLLPLKLPKDISDKCISPVCIPLIRLGMFENKVTLMKKEERAETIEFIYERIVSDFIEKTV